MIVRFLFLIVFTQQLFAIDFDPLRTSKANKAKEEAMEAYVAKNYDVAIARYKFLIDTLKIKNDKAILNLAHCYMRKADYSNAQSSYTDATKTNDAKIRSIAFQQLGILLSEKQNKEEALLNFKNALKNDPTNDQARFNYELLKKAKDKEMPKSDDKKDRDEQEKKDQEQKKKNEDQKKKDEQKKQDKGDKDKQDKDKQDDGDKGDKKDDKGEGGKKERKDGKNDLKEKDKENKDGKPDDQKKENKDGKKGEGEKDKKAGDEKKEGEGNKGKEEKPDEKGDKKGEAEKPSDKGEKKKSESEAVSVNKEQLQKMNMTEQQAKSILNAMRQGEAQYIQQMKRVPSKPHSNSGKKDW